MITETMWWYAFSFAVGASVGLSELLSRRSWTLRGILLTPAGTAYLGINGMVAGLAYCASIHFRLLDSLGGEHEIWRALVSSALGMGILRSAFAQVRIGNQDVGIGLTSLITVFLNRAQLALDRKLAKSRLEKVTDLVSGLAYSSSKNQMFALCNEVLKSLSQTDRDLLESEIDRIDVMDVDDSTKMILFAMQIAEHTDIELFDTLVRRAHNVSLSSSARAETKLNELAEARKRLKMKQ